MAELAFMAPVQAWESLIEYRQKYYRKYIAAYSGDRTELNATSDYGMFWQRQGRCKVHVPAAADIASTSADLLFAEEPSFTCFDQETEDNESAQQGRLDQLVMLNNVFGKLNEAAESCAALGDVYLKLNWWTDAIDYPVLTVVQGDSAWPEFVLGVLKCIHFFSVLRRDAKTGNVIRVYERYEPGRITMAIFNGNDSLLGTDMGEAVLEQYGFQRELIPPIDDMLAVHIPNMKPNRQHRDGNLGRSDFDELRNLMDSLDETYSSWMRDIRLAKARTIVPAEYLKRKPQEMLDGLAKSASWEFDSDVETYVAMDIRNPDGSIPGITMQQFAIRSSEHAATCIDILRNIYATAGYSPQSFGLDINGLAQSGTALHIREKKSYNTRGKKQTYWQTPLERILTAMVHLDNALWPQAGSDADDTVKVKFADSMANDISTMSAAVQALSNANAASTETMVMMLHPDWSKKQVAEEIERLKLKERLLMMNSEVMTKEEFRKIYLEANESLELPDEPEQSDELPRLIDNDAGRAG